MEVKDTCNNYSVWQPRKPGSPLPSHSLLERVWEGGGSRVPGLRGCQCVTNISKVNVKLKAFFLYVTDTKS